MNKIVMSPKWLAFGVGCSAPHYSRATPTIAMNASKRWNRSKMCTVFAHELGHLRGYRHSTDLYPVIMGQPLPYPGNGYPGWSWGPCG